MSSVCSAQRLLVLQMTVSLEVSFMCPTSWAICFAQTTLGSTGECHIAEGQLLAHLKPHVKPLHRALHAKRKVTRSNFFFHRSPLHRSQTSESTGSNSTLSEASFHSHSRRRTPPPAAHVTTQAAPLCQQLLRSPAGLSIFPAWHRSPNTRQRPMVSRKGLLRARKKSRSSAVPAGVGARPLVVDD